MNKITTKPEVKKDLYKAEKYLKDTIVRVNHPYLSEDDVTSICKGEAFDFKAKVPAKYFEYLLENGFLKKV